MPRENLRLGAALQAGRGCREGGSPRGPSPGQRDSLSSAVIPVTLLLHLLGAKITVTRNNGKGHSIHSLRLLIKVICQNVPWKRSLRICLLSKQGFTN